MDPQIFQKSRSHLKSLDAKTVTRNKFHTEDPKFLSDLWTWYLVLSAWCMWTTYFVCKPTNAV